MSDAHWRRSLVPTAASTLLALAAVSGARASCMSVTGDHVFALAAGDNCFASGAYNPTMAIPAAPANIVGLFAQDGGSITPSSGATFVTVNANAVGGSYGIWSEGAATEPLLPSQIDLAVPVTVTTSGASSFGLYASGGGAISTPDGLSVSTNGASSIGIYASGAASTISVTGASIVANRTLSTGVRADAGGVVTLTGGSVTLELAATDGEGLIATGAGSGISATGTSVVTKGVDAIGALSVSGAHLVLNGGSVTTNGDGSEGLATIAGSLSATGVSITTNGGVDLSGLELQGVSIGGPGATGALIGDTIMTSGAGADGILAEARGVATLRRRQWRHYNRGRLDRAARAERRRHRCVWPDHDLDRIDVGGNRRRRLWRQRRRRRFANQSCGDNRDDFRERRPCGLYASNGGAIDVAGVSSITTSGLGAIGLSAIGGGLINATRRLNVSTAGASAGAYGVNADGAGSQINLAGATTVTTAGTGDYGLYASNGGAVLRPRRTDRHDERFGRDRALRLGRRLLCHGGRRRDDLKPGRCRSRGGSRHGRARNAERRVAADFRKRFARARGHRNWRASVARRRQFLLDLRPGVDRALRARRRRHQRDRGGHGRDDGRHLW